MTNPKKNIEARRTPASPPPVFSRRAAVLWLPLLVLGIGVHVCSGRLAVRAQSPTFDEPLHLTAGFVYWKTRDYRLNAYHHPPLSSLVGAVPLLFMGPALPQDDPLWLQPRWGDPTRQYAFANRFLYHNASGLDADRMVNAGRYAMLFCSAVCLVGFFFAVRSVFGEVAASVAFLLAAVSPEFIAHGSLVTTDYLFTWFYFFFFYFLDRWDRSTEEAPGPGPRAFLWAGLTGMSLVLAFCSKFSAVAVGPAVLLWLFHRKFRPGLSFRGMLVCFATAAVSLLLVYQVTALPVFFGGLRYTLERLQGGRATFLLGNHSTEGWWFYFPTVFFLKTATPVLVGFLFSLGLALRKKVRWPWLVVTPPLVYFLAACASSVQIGHRHILPVYPFLFVMLGIAAAALWAHRPARYGLWALGVWLLAETFAARPWFLSYFNSLTAARVAGYEYLTDSNVDWGQGMRALRQYLTEQKVGRIYLSYFGTAEPASYGISYAAVAPYTLPAFADQDVDLRAEPRALLVVSATNLQSTYFADKDIFDWLKNRAPEKVLAGSLLVYDVTRDALSHQRLAGLFGRMGKPEMVRRESLWAVDLLGGTDKT
ncbi:MAG TPA: glycosyltransferase family 39 protein [Elusimicrobiota bacterium]|nr:glycosyltransferase family 39 protein [Elusimicrobiota bacterium]